MSQKYFVENDADDWEEIPAVGNDPLYRVLRSEIDKPKSDDRNYRFVQLMNGHLRNGIQALLIQDPGTDVAAVAMNVGVGYLSDPDDMQGLAHLCEHAIFMGEPECWNYVRTNGGSINAYTVESNTCYFISIGQERLKHAVTGFAKCFTSPAFEPEFVAKQLNTVESEFLAGQQSDPNRLYQVFRTNALPGSSWSKFPTGNTKSLTPVGGDETTVKKERCKRLREWWEEHYSASIMGLVILGRESLDDLTRMAFKFQHIRNNFISLPTEPTPWGREQQGKITFVKSIMDISTLEVYFCLPSQDRYYESKPLAFISRLLTHEGQGSLHSYLKHKQYITGLGIESSTSPRGFSFWGIKANLTEHGFENYELVLRAIYETIYLLRDKLTSPSSSGYFEEFKSIQNHWFYYSQRESVGCHVGRLSERLLLLSWPRKRLLKAATGVWKQDDEILRDILARLEPRAGSVTLASQKPPSLVPRVGNVASASQKPPLMTITLPWLKEKWYGTEYLTQDLESHLFKKTGEPPISLPGPNKYIPTNFNTKTTREIMEYPILLCDSQYSQLWFKQSQDLYKGLRISEDHHFDLPKGYIGVYLKSSTLYNSPQNTVMTELVECIIADALIDKFYDALVSGLQFSLVYNDDGNMVLQLGGYTDGMLILLGHLLEVVHSFIIPEEAFRRYKNKLWKNLKNAELAEPSTIARQLMERGLVGNAWTDMEMKHALPKIALEDVQEHLKMSFTQAETTLLVMGSFDKKDAGEVQSAVDQFLKDSSNSSDSTTRSGPNPMMSSANVVPEGNNWVYTYELPNTEEKSSAVRYYLQVNNDSTPVQARLLLLAHIINEPFFCALRTKDNLGYEVSSAPWVQGGVVGMLFMVQSERSTVLVENKIEGFLADFEGNTLTPMKDFESQRNALVEKLREKPENLDQESVRFAFTILSGRRNSQNYYDFDLRERIADEIATLDKLELMSFYNAFILPPPPVHAPSTSVPPTSSLVNTLNPLTPQTPFQPNEWERCFRKASVHTVSQTPHHEDSTKKRRPYDDVKDLRMFRRNEWLGTLPAFPTQ